MCELFGFCSEKRTDITERLKTFFSRSSNHPDGWGLATFHGDSVQLEKEPVLARDSVYLKHRLSVPVVDSLVLAHIRKASSGALEYVNTHPFVMRDTRGRAWTLIHNGVIYDSPLLDSYINIQQGACDSERVLIHFVKKINALEESLGRSATARERFGCVDDALHEMCTGNKINMILYDGELFYFHSNLKDTLHYKYEGGGILLSTKPLSADEEGWEVVPLSTLIAYKEGRELFRGIDRHHEYIKRSDDVTG